MELDQKRRFGIEQLDMMQHTWLDHRRAAFLNYDRVRRVGINAETQPAPRDSHQAPNTLFDAMRGQKGFRNGCGCELGRGFIVLQAARQRRL
jgi:hypothetical protein